MNVNGNSSIMLLGLSGSGKTHFLVALDVILDEQTDPNGLTHSDYAEDRAYIQPLREMWLRGEKLEHTNRQIPPPPHPLSVVHPATNTTSTFHIPDLAGEMFDSHFVTRSIPSELCLRIKEADGFILFVHSEHQADHTLHGHPFFAEASPEEAGEGATSSSEWRLEDASQQVKLVDLLQFVAELRTGVPETKVAVVVSAWDIVESAPLAVQSEFPKDPIRFLSQKWPLLNQYLLSNGKSFQSRFFGVSARGGGVEPEDIARLIGFSNARDRILVLDQEHRSNDITRPVRWLLGLLN